MPDSPVRPADKEQADRLHTFAHDIKNRLGGLWEALRLLRDGPAEGIDKEELMTFAERGFFSAQRDLEDLLDDFAVDRNVTADRSPFDLVDSLKEAARNEGYRLQKKDQRAEVSGPERAPAMGDARWTTQILQALLSNASKFSSRGSVITVELSMADNACSARVIDKGCGLSAEDLEGIFTRYAILSSHSTEGEPQSRGTLGRARQWAEAQGGTLTCTSAGPGMGSTFALALPSTA